MKYHGKHLIFYVILYSLIYYFYLWMENYKKNDFEEWEKQLNKIPICENHKKPLQLLSVQGSFMVFGILYGL